MKYIPSALNRLGGLAWYIALIVSVICLTGCSSAPPTRPEKKESLICKITMANAEAMAKEISERCIDENDKKNNYKKELIEVVDAAQSSRSYSLQFVEINDQGYFRDRRQADSAIEFAEQPPKIKDGRIYYVVYVHGWFHGPEMSDNHLPHLLEALGHLSRWRENGEVRGIYIGWRGNPLNLPLLEYLTFWDRKNVSEEVGRGSLQEFLLRLEATVQRNGAQNKLVTVGHSFGASVVFNALSHTLVQRFVDAMNYAKDESLKNGKPQPLTINPRGYGNLVVLINPAFEAMRFLPIYSMVQHFTVPGEKELKPQFSFDDTCRPYFVVLSSEADWATKVAFWKGRILSTIWESHDDIFIADRNSPEMRKEHSEWYMDRTTIGNYGEFTSYKTLRRTKGKDETKQCDILKKEHWKELRAIWEKNADKKKSGMFPGIDFILEGPYDPSNSPFLLTSVDKSIIENHSDIGSMDLVCWIVQLADD